MSKIDYQALREKAEKATCGVWSLEYGEERFDAGDALIHREVVGYLPICRIEGAHPESGFDEDFQMEQQANAEFIAAANPATVLALLDELEAAKKRIAELEAEPVSQAYKLNQLSGNSPVTPDSWISCSERMPNDAQWCVVDAADGYYVQCWSEGQGWLGDDISLRNCDVIRWMAIPEPPQQDGE
ncbi:ead/Ea22-like family protein [Escherichia coli]|nr:ead/Ea22-like family protein [Escherichia coli]HDL6441337.1 ead/Ea22-like family protein [Escherichia coli]HDL6455584.1 ead/Ea22-like family protein [Escherichia coli]